MLHVTTEVGKPGKEGREMRHFPGLFNQKSIPTDESRGRRYIPHGYGEDEHFRPHPQGLVPEYTDNGPDWKSQIRPIASPHDDKYPAEENWPDTWHPMRTYAGTNERTTNEWTMYPEGKGFGSTLRSTWRGEHKASRHSKNEITHQMRFGKGRVVVNKRNGIPVASLGDKSYQAPEYSQNFHQRGSTLPVVAFGGHVRKKADTFVPLIQLPSVPKEGYASKEKFRKMMIEIEDVLELENWRPATPLTVPPSTIHGQTSIHAHLDAGISTK